jgi:ATP-dependent DNA helicase 2 subunit 1
MGNIVRSVTFNSFNPEKYPNPALQWHYRILQALALEEELPEKPEDKTIPKYNSIKKRVGPFAVEWGAILDREAPEGRGVEAPRKRKAVSNGDDDEPQKIKREKRTVEAPSRDKIESLFEQGTLLTVWIVEMVLTG